MKGKRRRRSLLLRWKIPKSVFIVLVFIFTRAMQAWMGTLNYRFWRYDPGADPADEAFAGPALYVFWHEYLLLPVHARPNCRLTMLTSQHEDAEVLAQVARYIGMDVIRGSSYRGGVSALLKLIQKGRGTSLAVATDGPRGPRRQLAQGCVYLSSRLQIPVVLIGIGYERPWRIRRAWDQFAIPRPFSRVRTVLGPRIQAPPNLDREGIEQHRQWFEQRLTELTTLAEDWAENRCVVPNSEALGRHSLGCLKSDPPAMATISRILMSSQSPPDRLGASHAG